MLHFCYSNLYYNDFYVKKQSEIIHMSENLFYSCFYDPFFIFVL